MVDIILKYFPNLTEKQKEQFTAIGPLYTEWNERINVISRKDIDNLYEHHILHSLAIAKFMTPVESTAFLDLGTGGGFPGIPLAILWPECRFHLIDRIGKKITVAKSISESIGLENVSFQHGDSGECREKFDFVVSRAVMTLDKLIPLIRKNISKTNRNRLPNGLLCLKGGDLTEEIRAAGRPVLEVPLSDYFSEEFFETKNLIYCKL
ncbi:MAG: 16S rRNA (guanine(527)-N(7))-methyltransferase RsmG [Bacteroides sp.]|nr:16S rRNA (guanine(527)-N(7))-methyltransferase RsmG [Bacteroides sp.]MCM1413422.1 16S rRNA (guanine(527)-N(7))-methyltransferase RsmG [Bacteroides sp.]MCM1471367.1 16S rRNA (guanine(527)-N(7))-methyltransferase RsmG [Bacteroides sp.]